MLQLYKILQRDKQVVVPLERNGQTVGLHQRKFFVAIPFAYSTAGYGFLFNSKFLDSPRLWDKSETLRNPTKKKNV